MPKRKTTSRSLKALAALNLDLFQPELIQVPAPATLYTKIKVHAQRLPWAGLLTDPAISIRTAEQLPTPEQLYDLFERYNWMYFAGKLPWTKIEYSARMTSAGSYNPRRRLIRISRKYHEIFPEELGDTLKHEMLHIKYPDHSVRFRQEAARIGASVKARSHPALRKPPKYVYYCPVCLIEYPRQKRFAAASCGVCSKGGQYDDRFRLRLLKSPRRSG